MARSAELCNINKSTEACLCTRDGIACSIIERADVSGSWEFVAASREGARSILSTRVISERIEFVRDIYYSDSHSGLGRCRVRVKIKSSCTERVFRITQSQK